MADLELKAFEKRELEAQQDLDRIQYQKNEFLKQWRKNTIDRVETITARIKEIDEWCSGHFPDASKLFKELKDAQEQFNESDITFISGRPENLEDSLKIYNAGTAKLSKLIDKLTSRLALLEHSYDRNFILEQRLQSEYEQKKDELLKEKGELEAEHEELKKLWHGGLGVFCRNCLQYEEMKTNASHMNYFDYNCERHKDSDCPPSPLTCYYGRKWS